MKIRSFNKKNFIFRVIFNLPKDKFQFKSNRLFKSIFYIIERIYHCLYLSFKYKKIFFNMEDGVVVAYQKYDNRYIYVDKNEIERIIKIESRKEKLEKLKPYERN